MKTSVLLIGVALLLCRALPAHAQAKIRVMTYNIRHAEGLDGNMDLDRIAAIINETRADVVCLQEVDKNLPRTGHADFPKRLAEKLHMNVVFGDNYHFDGGDYGNATFTRFAIESSENIPLPGPSDAEPRGCLRTTVTVEGQRIDVLNTHFGLKPAERADQAAAVAAALHPIPTILAGDLNENRDAPAVRVLMENLADADGPGTVTSSQEASTKHIPGKIDFILVSGHLNVLLSCILKTPQTEVASDHLPWVADLRVTPPRDDAAEKGVHDNDDERVSEALKAEGG